MKTVEFLGIARAGKTTTAESLKSKYSEIEFYPERHDLVPEEILGDVYKYSIWYAEYCVRVIRESIDKDKINIIERGIVDHITMGNVYYKMGWFDDSQYEEYSRILKPYISRIDIVVVFLIPVMESVKRASINGKDVSKAIPYMKDLYDEYKKLSTWHPNVKYLPEKATLEELLSLSEEIIYQG